MDTSAQCKSSRNSTNGWTRARISASSAPSSRFIRSCDALCTSSRICWAVVLSVESGATCTNQIGAICPHHPVERDRPTLHAAGCPAPRAPAGRLQCRRAAPSTCREARRDRCGPACTISARKSSARLVLPIPARQRSPRQCRAQRPPASNAFRNSARCRSRPTVRRCAMTVDMAGETRR